MTLKPEPAYFCIIVFVYLSCAQYRTLKHLAENYPPKGVGALNATVPDEAPHPVYAVTSGGNPVPVIDDDLAVGIFLHQQHIVTGGTLNRVKRVGNVDPAAYSAH